MKGKTIMKFTYDKKEHYILGEIEERPTKVAGKGALSDLLSRHNRQRIIAMVYGREDEDFGELLASAPELKDKVEQLKIENQKLRVECNRRK